MQTQSTDAQKKKASPALGVLRKEKGEGSEVPLASALSRPVVDFVTNDGCSTLPRDTVGARFEAYWTETIMPSDPRASCPEMRKAIRSEIHGLIERNTLKIVRLHDTRG